MEYFMSSKPRKSSGKNEGSDYIPALHIRHVPSKGLSSRIKGIITNRVHQLLSKLELHYFYTLDWGQKCTDIREQYPLDIDETLAIAKSIGVKHPTNSKTGKPYQMTTDFLITTGPKVNQQYSARTVKYAESLANLRTLEKFEIERIYYERRSIDWGIVTELEINTSLVKNIEWVHSFYNIDRLLPLTESDVHELEEYLYEALQTKDLTLRVIASVNDKKLNLPPGTCLSVIRHMISRKKIFVDMANLIKTNERLYLLDG